MRLPKAVWGIIVAIVIAAIIGIGVFVVQNSPKAAITVPADVAEKLDFTPMIVVQSEDAPTTSNYKAAKVEDGTLVFSYILRTSSGVDVTVSQYTQPTQFTDIPDYKEKFLTNVIEQQTSVSTSGGTIYVGQMAKQDKKQLAVMIERGLIVFMAPSQSLEQKEWRDIGDNLDVVKLR